MSDIVIRRVTSEEISQLREVGMQTFSETFSSENSVENMQTYLENGFAKEKLEAELGDSNTLFYFAVFNSQVIGYLKLNFGSSQTELQDGDAMEIERIYVLKEFHGKKVGQLFYEKALQIAKEKCVQFIWLGVWEHNERAIGFYKKNGFVAFDKHVFRLGDDEQTDIMMRLQIN